MGSPFDQPTPPDPRPASAPASPAPEPVIATKLHWPRPRADRIARPRLVQQLDQAWTRPLTILAAPAGFGKSSLLSEWIAQSPRPVAWLGLDESDNNPNQFWTYVIAALRTLRPNLGAGALAALAATQAPPTPAILTSLVNDLSEAAGEFVLVLEDFHLIRAPSIHAGVTFLLNHLPAQAHLLLSSRADPPLPLAQLRARGQLVEVRADDLRFTPAEAEAFLNQVMKLELAASHVKQLTERTEGWIAGLQLAGLSLRGRPDPAGFVAAFTGSHRFVLDYLTEQVWGQQPPDIQAFLLQTAVLDRLSGPLCDAVTQQPGSQAILERLERDNMFLIALDEERRWYRFHHLFADVLRARLERSPLAQQQAQLHLRASEWNRQQGLAADAIFHALAAQDYARAADLIEQAGMAVHLAGRVQTVVGWLAALPESLTRARPWLAVMYALGLMVSNDLTAGRHWLQVAEQALADGQPVAAEAAGSLRGWLTVCHCELNLAVGDVERSITRARAALTEMSGEETAWWPLRLRAACAYQYNGDVSPAAEQAVASLTAALAATRDGNLLSLLNGLTFLARLQVLQGRLRAARQTYAQAVSAWPPSMPVVNPAYLFGLADIHREQNEFEQAEKLFAEGLDLTSALTMDADVLAAGYLGLARLKLGRGDGQGALQLLRGFEDRARRGGYFEPWVTSVVAAQARVHLALGNRAAAAAWAAASGLSSADDVNYLRELEYLTLARVWTAQGRTREALRLLERWLGDAEAKNRWGSAIQMLVLSALAWRAQGEPAQARASLQRALALGEPEAYVRVFADEGAAMAALLAEANPVPRPAYVQRLLAASTPLAEPPAPAGEPLRPRELEVLHLIAAGLSNQEIASQLVLGRGTIKTHVNNLFRKLDVNSRTQAIARARQLGWLRD